MITASPMQGKKVLVPRGEKQAKSFSQLVKKYGGIPIEIPLIAFRPVALDSRLHTMIAVLSTYDWIIFTSKVTVETFLTFLDKKQINTLPRMAVIGEKTEKLLCEKGLKAEFLPSEYVAETFVEEFRPYVQTGMKVLIPKGNLARDYIASSLRNFGADVDEAVIYENFLPEESRARLAKTIGEDGLDILLFTSSSTVDHFVEVIKHDHLESHLKNCLIGCIGPVTKEKIKSYGLTVHASPEVYTVEEMLKSMNTYIEENNRR